MNTPEIDALKVKVFDLLAEQSRLNAIMQEIEKTKRGLLDQIAALQNPPTETKETTTITIPKPTNQPEID